MNLRTLLLILVSVAMSAGAQIVLKTGLRPDGTTSAPTGILDTLQRMLLNPLVLGGLALYFLSAILWLFVLSRVDVSYAYPFVSLGFVITMALGYLLLGEHVTAGRVLGTALIVIGVIFVARSA